MKCIRKTYTRKSLNWNSYWFSQNWSKSQNWITSYPWDDPWDTYSFNHSQDHITSFNWKLIARSYYCDTVCSTNWKSEQRNEQYTTDKILGIPSWIFLVILLIVVLIRFVQIIF